LVPGGDIDRTLVLNFLSKLREEEEESWKKPCNHQRNSINQIIEKE
jgi:hypothetical protein